MPPKSPQTASETCSFSSGDGTASSSPSRHVQTVACSPRAHSAPPENVPLVKTAPHVNTHKRAFADSSVDWEHLNNVFLTADAVKDVRDVQRIRLHTIVSSRQNHTRSISELSQSDKTRASSSLAASITAITGGEKRDHSLLRISTRSFIAVVSCVGVLLVLLLTIAAVELWGLRDATTAIYVVQSETMQTLLEAMRLDLQPLGDFLAAVGSPFFMYSELPARQNMSNPEAHEEVKVALATIMSQKMFADHVAFVQMGEFTPYNRWRVLVVAPDSPDQIYGAMENGLDSKPVDLRLCSTTTRKFVEPPVCLPNVQAHMDDLMTGHFALSRNLAPWSLSFTQNNDSLVVDPLRVFSHFRSDEIENFTAEAARARAGEDPLSCYVFNATRLYRRISTFNYTTYYTPIDMVVPFATQEGYGFLEAAIRWDSFTKNSMRMHRNMLNGRGEFALISSGLIVVKSWEHKVPSDEGRTPEPIPVHRIDNPLMKATVAMLDKYKGDAEGWKRRVHRYKFHFRGDRATTRVFSFSHKGDPDFVFVATALDKYTLNPIYEKKTRMIFVFACVFAVFTLLAYITAGIVKEDLYKLKPFLKQCSTLQFASLPPLEPSLFLELQHIQSAFVALQRQLMSLKTYIPGPLLILTSCSSGDDSETDDDALGDSWTTASGPESDDQQEEPAEGGDGARRDTLLRFAGNRWRQGYHLNTKIFKEKLNVFHRRHCTLVWLCRFYTNDVSTFDMDSLFRASHIGSLNFNGCFEFMRPDYVVLSFGAHTPLLMHANRASECASFVWSKLSPSEQAQVIIFVDTAEFLVGTCGVEGVRRSRVVFDINHLIELGSIFRIQNMNGVFATSLTASQLTNYLCIPIVRTHLSQTTAPYIVFAIRQIPPDACPLAAAQLSKRFRSAFHYMCEGKYGEAAQLYRLIGERDATAKRLLQVCQTYIATNRTEGYLLYSVHSCMQYFGYFFKSKHYRLFNIVAALYLLRNYQLYLARMSALAPNTETTQIRSLPSPLILTGSLSRGNPAPGAPAAAPAASSKGGATTTTTTMTTTSTNTTTSAATPGPTATETHVSTVSGGDAVSEGSKSLADMNLVELINIHSSSSSSTSARDRQTTPGMYSPSSVFESLPAVIVDADDQRWVRSREPIGKGAFAVAYKGMSEDGVQVALKCIQVRRKASRFRNLQSEIKMFAQLRHPNIVQYISSKVTSKYVCIVMEYAPGGSLYDLLQIFGSFNAQTIKPFTQATLAGLSYLHSRGITHCDVKPHNMLLGVGSVCKLSDFGRAVQVDMQEQGEQYTELELRGTAVYMAPEVAKGETCTPASDIFSLGVSLLELVTGRLPWAWSITASPTRDIKGIHALYHNTARFVQCVGRGEVRVDVPIALDSEMAAFCSACCHVNPARRPSAQELMSFPYLL